jgi:hypothetical protein
MENLSVSGKSFQAGDRVVSRWSGQVITRQGRLQDLQIGDLGTVRDLRDGPDTAAFLAAVPLPPGSVRIAWDRFPGETVFEDGRWIDPAPGIF